MNDNTRREFLHKLAQGVVYTAPVISTLSVPENLFAQGQSPTKKKGGGGGKGKATAPAPVGPAAPGTAPIG